MKIEDLSMRIVANLFEEAFLPDILISLNVLRTILSITGVDVCACHIL